MQWYLRSQQLRFGLWDKGRLQGNTWILVSCLSEVQAPEPVCGSPLAWGARAGLPALHRAQHLLMSRLVLSEIKLRLAGCECVFPHGEGTVGLKRGSWGPGLYGLSATSLSRAVPSRMSQARMILRPSRRLPAPHLRSSLAALRPVASPCWHKNLQHEGAPNNGHSGAFL